MRDDEHIDPKSEKLFLQLKSSPLAKQDVAVEEVAIWLDVNGLSTARNAVKMLKCCASVFWTRIDWLEWPSYTSNLKKFRAANGSSKTSSLSIPHFELSHATSAIFKNLFNVLFNTSLLDKECFNEKFIAKVSKMRQDFKKKIFIGCARDGKTQVVNKKTQDLYEIFSELEEKLIEKAQLL